MCKNRPARDKGWKLVLNRWESVFSGDREQVCQQVLLITFGGATTVGRRLGWAATLTLCFLFSAVRQWKEVSCVKSPELQVVLLEGREKEGAPIQTILPLPVHRPLSHKR